LAKTLRIGTRQKIDAVRSDYTRWRRREFSQIKHVRKHGTTVAGNFDWRTNRVIIRIPTILDLAGNRHHTYEVARACRTNCLLHKKPTLLDFSDTKVISSAAILFLVAEIDRCRRFAGVHMLTGTFPRDKTLNTEMRDSGFYEALGVQCNIDGKAKIFPMEYFKVRSGNEADGRIAKELRLALLGPQENLFEKGKRNSFFRGIGEAMTNVSQHAYPIDLPAGPIKTVDKGWWMLGHINKKSRQLKIMIVDQGVGIPRTLPRKYREVMNEFFAKIGVVSPTDGNIIRAAMEVGRSRTLQTNRGKGLNDLKEIIDKCNAGSLRILSKKGEYHYKIVNGRVEETALSTEESLNGTLVEWSIPLRAVLPFLLNEEMEDENV
jgi:anti-anti-sigma regulatory factor